VKTAQGNTQARMRAAFETAFTGALDSITTSGAQGWFRNCGYAL